MKKILIVLASTALLTACGPTKYAFVKKGSDAQETQSAVAQCNYQIQLQKTPQTQQNNLRQLCMEGQGYRVKRVN